MLSRRFGILCFLGLVFVASVQGQTRPLVLISESTSTRAIALESITFTREPFPLTSLISWRPDTRTRIILFALNLRLRPDEEPWNVTVDAEDGTQRHYPLQVEYVEPVRGQRWMSAVSIRLNDQMDGVGDVLVRIYHQGRSSNRVRIAIGRLGGGLVDDPGSGPTPAPPPYAVRGRITVDGSPLAGATVSLSGDTSAVTSTDSAGNYSILVPSAADCILSASKEDYVFEPPNYSLLQIDGERNVDFRATYYCCVLSGRVAGSDGLGVFGVNVSLSGTQTGTTSTSSDGTYSFIVPGFANYVLRPSKEQDYYTFAPQSIVLTGRPGNRTANFVATLEASITPSYVLEFDGAPKSVDYSMPLPEDSNLFWPDGVEYGHFFWEFWAMPFANAHGTYMISDGYGGAHAILFGILNYSPTEPGRYQLGGNIWNGNNYTDFASDEGPAPNEWGHFAVGWDGTNITTYFNGVPVGKTLYVGPRITPGPGQGCGRLLIGGSDHQNFIGRIAQVRGFENDNPREIGGSVSAAFAPQTVFSVDGSLLSYFFRPSTNIADLSSRGQYGRQHPGLVRSTANGILSPCSGCPLPQFVVDPTAPDFARPNQPGQLPAPVDPPDTVPGGALIFDSFSRRNSTYVLNGLGGLGSSEGGALGPQTWRTNEPTGNRQPFGILLGHGVVLANATALAWINAPSVDPNFDIRADRHPGGFGTGQDTGISFRVTDSSNYFFAYSSENSPSQPRTLTVGYYAAGRRTLLASGLSMPTTWTTLRVVTKTAGTLDVYGDNTLLYSTTNNFLADSPGMGLYSNGPGLGLTNRWDNFRVFTPQP